MNYHISAFVWIDFGRNEHKLLFHEKNLSLKSSTFNNIIWFIFHKNKIFIKLVTIISHDDHISGKKGIINLIIFCQDISNSCWFRIYIFTSEKERTYWMFI